MTWNQVIVKIRRRYGFVKDEAERQVKRFEKAAEVAFMSAAQTPGVGKPARKQKAGKRVPKRRVRVVVAKKPKR